MRHGWCVSGRKKMKNSGKNTVIFRTKCNIIVVYEKHDGYAML
jgi:hypothetical protein